MQLLFRQRFHKEYCFAVKLNGQLEVEYFHVQLAYQRLALFLAGILICFLSVKLKNEILYYVVGVSLAIFCSLLLPAAIIWNFSIFALSLTILNFLDLNFGQDFIYYYIVAIGLISCACLYYQGPISDPKLIVIIKWFVRLFGFYCIYLGISYSEMSYSIICIYLIGFIGSNIDFDFNKLRVLRNCFRKIFYGFKYRYFPTTRKLLTVDEYITQTSRFTSKELEELKKYCKSSFCDTWRLCTRISRPERLAKFVSNNHYHLTDDELLEHERHSMDLIVNTDDEI